MNASGNERRGLRRKLVAALSTVALAVAGGELRLTRTPTL